MVPGALMFMLSLGRRSCAALAPGWPPRCEERGTWGYLLVDTTRFGLYDGFFMGEKKHGKYPCECFMTILVIGKSYIFEGQVDRGITAAMGHDLCLIGNLETCEQGRTIWYVPVEEVA